MQFRRGSSICTFFSFFLFFFFFFCLCVTMAALASKPSKNRRCRKLSYISSGCGGLKVALCFMHPYL